MAKMERIRSSDKNKFDEIRISLKGDELLDFQRYQKIKTAIILWNCFTSSICFFVFFVSTWRLVTGIKHPWLFQYAFSEDKVYDAVHAVEINYFPKSLTYVDMIYVVTPIYASVLYASNAFIVAVSASLRNYETLKIIKNVSTGMTVPCLVMVAFFGK